MRAQHGKMVRHRFCVRRAHPNIRQCHTLPEWRGQMIGRHLEFLPRRCLDQCLDIRIARRRRNRRSARQDQTVVRPVLTNLVDAPPDELIDIAVIIRQQNPRLHRAPIRSRIMYEAAQRIIDTHRIKKGQRSRAIIPEIP